MTSDGAGPNRPEKQTKKEILEVLHTSKTGLSKEEATKRLKENGFNEFESKTKKSILKLIFEQLLDKTNLILIAAGTLSLILAIVEHVTMNHKDYIESIVIFAIVILNSFIAILQERKAENALEALKKMGAPHAKVYRDNDLRIIYARELVKGDIVFIEAGDIVPADLRLLETNDLIVEEATLTGESLGVNKNSEIILKDNVAIGDKINLAYMSTIVANGNALGVVYQTGMQTEVGKIAKSLKNQDNLETPLKKKLADLGKKLSIVALIICAIVIILDLIRWDYSSNPLNFISFMPTLMTAVALAISVIPEGLPAIATVIMALGVERMSKKNALVKQLPSVETLGGATVICTDKTGTLTQNKMSVVEVALDNNFLDNSTSLIKNINNNLISEKLYLSAILCNNADFDPLDENKIIGDPTEGALLNFAKSYYQNLDEIKNKYQRIAEEPFDSSRKLMSVILKKEDYLIITKGAVEEILNCSKYFLTSDGIKELTSLDKKRILNLANSMASRALRVLGFAYKNNDALLVDNEEIESDLIFIGLVGMIDPPREEVRKSIITCKEAGIRTVMITGDHKLTAIAIAKNLGIYDEKEGHIALNQEELNNLNDEDLKKIIQKVTVFSRVSPEDKLRIVKILNEVGEITAMTGDGVNDAPALKAANIGIAMGSGTEVAKDAADLILLDDNFKTIEVAIKEGRRIYNNILKVVQFLLAGNIAEIIMIILAQLINWPAPLIAIHILVINLVTDSIPALALGVDPASKKIMKVKPIKTNSLFANGLAIRVRIHGIFIALSSFSIYMYGILGLKDPQAAMTMSFLVLSISQIIHSFNQRSNIDSIFSPKDHNKWLYIVSFGALGVVAFIAFTPKVMDIFKLVYLEPINYLYVLLISLVPLVLVEIQKLIKRFYLKHKK